MKLPIYTVDAFTDVPFKGNPAAVCIVERTIHESLMQNIAFEMNLSETAFLYKADDGYNLRWFTPTAEVDLCGHATLASSHILWQTGRHQEDEIRFHTKSGLLTAKRADEGIQLDFPGIAQNKIDYPKELETALGVKPTYVGMTKWNYLVEIASDEELRKITPDFDLLESLEGWGTIVTAKSSSGEFDFISRFFAPEKGIPEDPVTGSAHCVLGPYWSGKLGRNKFNAYQASQRGGYIGVEVKDDRVLLTGKAVTFAEGTMNV
jgi:PhzF family phenazine biosynthesis protein